MDRDVAGGTSGGTQVELSMDHFVLKVPSQEFSQSRTPAVAGYHSGNNDYRLTWSDLRFSDFFK